MEIRPLPDKLQEIAQNNLNEVPSRVLDDLKDVEEWLLKQPHLSVRKDRQWLLAFLRNSKFSLQRTKEKVDYFHTLKSITPEFFANRDPMLPEVQEILKAGIILPLTKTTNEAGFPTIMYMNWKNADPNKMSVTDLFKVSMMITDVLLNNDDNFTVNGSYIVHDMAEFPISYATHLTPTLCKKLVLTITKAYPARIKGLYYMNTPPLIEKLINMFVPFMSEKIKSRIKIYGQGSFDKLSEEIPLTIVPKDCGGEGQYFHEITAEWKKIMENHRDWFLEDAQYIADETKRPGKPKTSADIFGVEGSFRKLNVD